LKIIEMINDDINTYISNQAYKKGASPRRISEEDKNIGKTNTRPIRNNYSSSEYNTITVEEVSAAPKQASPRHASPREYKLGSPARSGKPKDPATELNTLSRFFTNNMLIKVVENLVFELVPEFVNEEKRKREAPSIKREPSFDFERKKNQTKKEAIRSHNKELMSVMKKMDQDDGNVVDSDDTDEKSQVNQIIESKEKKEFKNKYAKNRVIDSIGIKFETNKTVNGVKGITYQEKGNLPMIDVKSTVTRQVHEFGDVWCKDCFDLIKEGAEAEHQKSCRPYLSSKEVIEAKAEVEVTELPYTNEMIFKVAKAITQYLAEVMKTNAGIFDETVEIRFLRNIRQKAEDIEKNNRNIKALEIMLDTINQITYDSKGNSELYWVFVFSKRLQKLTDDKIGILEKIKRSEAENKTENVQDAIRQSFINNSNLRLTTIKEKMSQSINFDDVKTVLMSPYRRETKIDTRLKELKIKDGDRNKKIIN